MPNITSYRQTDYQRLLELEKRKRRRAILGTITAVVLFVVLIWVAR
jgi:hypothetical protein